MKDYKLPPPPQRRDELRYDKIEIQEQLQRERDPFRIRVLESRLHIVEMKLRS